MSIMETPLSFQEFEILKAVARYYHETLKRRAEPQEYLERSGLFDPGLLREYQIGYSEGGLPKDDESLEALKRLGLVSASGEEYFKDCLIFPIENLRGEIVGFSGRDLQTDEERFLGSRPEGMFNLARVKGARRIFLTPSLLDALSLIRLGLKDSLFFRGNEEFPEEWRLLEGLACEEICLCLSPECRERVERGIKERFTRAVRLSSWRLPAGLTDANHLLIRGFKKEDLIETETPASDSGFPLEEKEGEFLFRPLNRTYQIRRLPKEPEGSLKVRLKLTSPEGSHLDLVDLQRAREREGFAKRAARLLDLERGLLEKDLERLSEAFELFEARRLFEKKTPLSGFSFPMNEGERREALEFLKDPRLPERIVEDAKAIGHVGEEKNFLLAYLVSISRKLARPLGLLILSQSGAGKTALQEKILSLTPPEDRLRLTRLTNQALFYQEKDSLRHKLIAVEEEAGLQGAGYSIRHLLTAHSLTSLTTLKEEGKERPVSKAHEVEGPVALMMTTTNSSLHYETLNRFIVMTVDESQKQTRAILEAQRRRETLQGLMEKNHQEAIQRRHHNAQRLLEGLEIVNPFAEKLHFSTSLLRARREQGKYLGLMKAIAFLRQYQKEAKEISNGKGTVRYLEVDPKDLEITDELAREILFRGLGEATPLAQSLLYEIREFCEKKSNEEGKGRGFLEAPFTRREIREYTGWSDYQLRRELARLVELEYLIPLTGRKGKRFLYTLAWEGERPCLEETLRAL